MTEPARGMTGEEADANARLIAKAWLIPELTDVLREIAGKRLSKEMPVKEYVDGYAEAVERVCAILAKLDAP